MTVVLGIAGAADVVGRDLVAELGGHGEVEALRRLSGGASRETWSFTHVVDGRHRRLVLRQDPVDGPERHGSMALEVAAIRAAERAGVPVPHVVAAGADFVITEHVDGEALGPRIVRSPELDGARRVFAHECGAALAHIHGIDPGEVPGIVATDPIGDQEQVFRQLGAPSAAVALGFRLLRDHPPTAAPQVVVHGDLRNGNLIVGPEGLRSVLDWELVHLGHPVDDLGWLCTRAWSFGGPHPVGGIGTYDELLDGYASVAGWRPELDDLRWWQLLGSVRWAVACLRASARYRDGSGATIDAAALARRASENEADVLAVIGELGW